MFTNFFCKITQVINTINPKKGPIRAPVNPKTGPQLKAEGRERRMGAGRARRLRRQRAEARKLAEAAAAKAEQQARRR